MKIDQHRFNAESDLIESLLNHDSSIVPSSSKIDSLLDEFAGELTLLKSFPPGIDKTHCDHENEIRLTKRLLYDNSSPRPPKEFVFENSNADIESFSPSPIPIEDSNSLMKEIDLSFTLDDPMPPGIEEDDYDSERDILIREELLDNYSLSLPVIESYHFDIPSFFRPPTKPPDVVQYSRNLKTLANGFCTQVFISSASIGNQATPTQAWLWHQRLSNLNFDYINLISKKDIVIGLPKLKYVKDQLCSSCDLSKANRSSFKSKAVPSLKGRLNLLHMDLCGPMRVASINGKKYILLIVDDYSRYTWTLFLCSKDETPEVLKDFLMMIYKNLKALVITVRTDRGTKFLNKTLNAFFKEEGIEHQTSTARTPK
nr:retrovirus-related Pol polyprotein from transposon TNT 1-94 [Tanacetum cinerariifolium]